MVKVSVILPVYNVEDFLRDCLDSIVNQTLTDIEIICINDGSTDKSLDILNEYASKDKRMTVIDQENSGHAVATNVGIEVAKGKYLFTMDSDDILKLNALELTYEKAKEKDVDFVLFKAINYDNTHDKYYETEVYSMDKIAKKVGDNVFNYKDIGNLIFQASVTPWSKLYNREFIIKNNIRFPEGLIFEDNVFFYEALFCAKKIYFLKEFLFIRRWYSTSSTTNGDLRFLNSIDVINLMIDVFKKHGEYDTFKKELYNKKVKLGLMRYSKIKNEFKEDYFKALKEDFVKILNNSITYNDFMNSASYSNKKIFEQVIISQNASEFNTLRKVYDLQMKSNSKKHNIIKELLTKKFTEYDKLSPEYKEQYFKNMKEVFIELLYDKKLYDEFIENTVYENKKKIEQILISQNSTEYELLKKLYNKHMYYDSLPNKISNLSKELEEIKEFNNELINSNSWKLTKILRI